MSALADIQKRIDDGKALRARLVQTTAQTEIHHTTLATLDFLLEQALRQLVDEMVRERQFVYGGS